MTSEIAASFAVMMSLISLIVIWLGAIMEYIGERNER